MELLKATAIKLNCSDFMTEIDYCNNDVTFLIIDTDLRTYNLYLIFKFILSKYKYLINDSSYLKEIEKYIEIYENSENFTDVLYFCIVNESKFYREYLFQYIENIDEFVTRENVSTTVIIDKVSNNKNQYVCFMKE